MEDLERIVGKLQPEYMDDELPGLEHCRLKNYRGFDKNVVGPHYNAWLSGGHSDDRRANKWVGRDNSFRHRHMRQLRDSADVGFDKIGCSSVEELGSILDLLKDHIKGRKVRFVLLCKGDGFWDIEFKRKVFGVLMPVEKKKIESCVDVISGRIRGLFGLGTRKQEAKPKNTDICTAFDPMSGGFLLKDLVQWIEDLRTNSQNNKFFIQGYFVVDMREGV